ncbi:MAG: serine/threonine-protein kinase [Actinomycetota bacterium]|nr:serine/threonine-protein kinase [Actinomycetota bacterium]
MKQMSEEMLLDRYQILDELGSGGFARVYKAFDTRMERVVAIKQIPTSSKTAPRALREARTVALLNHPNIVTLYEFEETEDYYYLIMEHLNGVVLADILDGEQITPGQSVAVAIQICQALECAHLNNVIHRDIKPENLMLLPDGRIKVMDFGISRLKTSPATREGDILGTLAYMSPEQAEGQLVDERTDIFSLGVVLYQILTGVSPFEAQAAGATIFKILNFDPPPPSELNKKVSRRLDALILKAIGKYPDDRFDTATEMRYKLERCLGSRVSPQRLLKPLARTRETERVEEVEIPFGRFEEFKERLWDFGEEHGEALKRVPCSLLVVLVGWLVFKNLPWYPPSLSPVIPVILFLAVLLAPLVGVTLFMLSVVPPVLANHLPLGILLFIFLCIYWSTFVRQQPLVSLVPLVAPLLADLKLGLTFPVLMGIIFPPVSAGALAGLGCLSLGLYDIARLAPMGVRFFGLAGGRPIPDLPQDNFASILDFFRIFAEQPHLLLQIALWIIVGMVVATLVRRRYLSVDILGIIAGFALLVFGYSWLPSHLGMSPVPLGEIMQELSLSLIIVLALLLIVPYRHLKERRRLRSRSELGGRKNKRESAPES